MEKNQISMEFLIELKMYQMTNYVHTHKKPLVASMQFTFVMEKHNLTLMYDDVQEHSTEQICNLISAAFLHQNDSLYCGISEK